MSLISILEKYQSVDIRYGTDKNTLHSYGDVYEVIFSKKKYEVRNLLEIGVFSGASTQAWTEYFPNVHVDGIDITLSSICFGKDNPRITFHEMDATTENARGFFANKRFDIIIDDGSHIPNHQIQSFKLFAPLLAENGVYVIEDIDNRTANQVYEATCKIAVEYGLRSELYDLREKKKRWDDIVAVFYK